MDVFSSSYDFHERIESPLTFVRREWQPILVFGGGFTIVMMFAILVVDPSYFYPRLSTDPLLYYLKGLSFAEFGHTSATLTVNRPAFRYVAMPGVLRSPFMMIFDDFDSQLRAIQISNVAIVALVAVMHAYIVSWVLPVARHWIAIGFAFGFMLLSPVWAANVFSPLAEAPYSAFTLATLILIVRLVCSERGLRHQIPTIVLAIAFFALAFLVKFTAPALLLFAAVLVTGRARKHGTSGRRLITGGAAAFGVLLLLLALNWDVLSKRYFPDLLHFYLNADKVAMLFHLVGSALPSQVIPDFHLAFSQPPALYPYRPALIFTTGDLVLAVVGVMISATMFFGIWKARDRFAPEIAYFLCALPLLALIIPSTARYLMAYQPIIWVFFYLGAATLVRPITSRVHWNAWLPIGGLLVATALAGGLVLLRSTRLAGTEAKRATSISIGETRAYVGQVSSTFRDLRGFLDSLDRSRTLLIGTRGNFGRWKAISGLSYFRPDSALPQATVERDVYLLLECGTFDTCQRFSAWERLTQDSLNKFGKFEYQSVFARSTEHAKAQVFRMRIQP
ncbi:MAG: hypothetical protein WKF55_16290 [Gemmatimonadaceae bacterium]